MSTAARTRQPADVGGPVVARDADRGCIPAVVSQPEQPGGVVLARRGLPVVARDDPVRERTGPSFAGASELLRRELPLGGEPA